MIQINVPTTSKGGAQVGAGSVLNINVTIVTRKELVNGDVAVKYDVGFDSNIYESFAKWRSDINSEVIVRGEMVEYPASKYISDVPLASLSAAALQELYKDIIENGDSNHPGIGVGNAIVIPA
jgi:hypothetical protein